MILQYHILPLYISRAFYIYLNNIIFSLINVKIKIHGNTDYLKNNNTLQMSNHYDGFLDCNILYYIYYKHNNKNTLYTVVKDNLVGDEKDKKQILILLVYIKNAIMQALYFIPYKRGDKDDGVIVKDIISDYLNNGKNILVFPEGTTHKDGVPRDFKHGIFQLAVKQKMNILPITIKYEKDIGTERGEPLDFRKVFDNVVDIYIHEYIDSREDECYQEEDYMALKEKTLAVILGGGQALGASPHTPLGASPHTPISG
jgi:1-acyl-sn-glycerol-3-phosphate acyltransferase